MDRTKDREKRAVLIIDNDRQGAETLKNQLVEGGYQVYIATTLPEALKVAREPSVVVALLALGRPGLDPQSLIQRLPKKKNGGQLPVVVIIESFAEDQVAWALKAGAADYLAQPFDSQELLRRTGVWARLGEGRVGADEAEIAALQVLEPLSSGRKLLARFLPGFADRLQSGFRTGELLGQRYEKVARLGLGSFGEVWKVRDVVNVSPAFFVAKIPLSKKLNLKIEKEARILRTLAGHAGVPGVHEIIDEKKKRVLIQEFVEGKTLFEVIERELKEKEVESVVIQLMDIVAHAHKLGIIHRDIKPGNVMVKPDGTIKLLDFGAAKELKEQDISGTVTGSRPYMSPEQIMGKSQRRSDVWALGVVMYVLYTGMFPFYHEVEKVLMDMILEFPPPPPSKHNQDLAPEIERVILDCLKKNPEERYPDAGALKEAIRANFPDYGCKLLALF